MALPQVNTDNTEAGSARKAFSIKSGSSTPLAVLMNSVKSATIAIKKDMQEKPFLEAEMVESLEKLEDGVEDNKVITEDITSIVKEQNDVLSSIIEDLKELGKDKEGPSLNLSDLTRGRDKTPGRRSITTPRNLPRPLRQSRVFMRRSPIGRVGLKGGLAGLVGGLALDYGSRKAMEAGYTRLGAGLDITSSTLSGAGYGAMIGSVIPGLGTTVGGIIGGAIGGGIGLYQNWSNLTGSGQGQGQGQGQPGPSQQGPGQGQGQTYQYSSDITPDISIILETIKDKESRTSGLYTAQNPGKGMTASGAYQFIDSSWQALTKKYGIGQEFQRAKDAPPQIQDAIAARYIKEILQQANGDVSQVPVAWYTGHVHGQMNAVQEAYVKDWMQKYTARKQGGQGGGGQNVGPGNGQIPNSTMTMSPAGPSPQTNNMSTQTNAPQLTSITTKSGKNVQVASNVADKFQGFLNDLEETGYKIRDISGYANRVNANNPSVMSAHAYGLAIDINPKENPNRSTTTDMPPEVSSMAAKWGLGWGMNWQSVKDPMHFSAASNEGGSLSMPTTDATAQGLSINSMSIRSEAAPSASPCAACPARTTITSQQQNQNNARITVAASNAAKNNPRGEVSIALRLESLVA